MGKHFSAEDKVKILKEHLLGNKPLSSLCDKYGVHISTFYEWQKLLFEGAIQIFERNKNGRKEEKKQAERIDILEKKLTKKDSALAELLGLHIDLKKKLGEL
ncbi:MAG: transposase [Bdellovibrionota bacterium]|jgi:transposase-like protein